MYNHSMDKVREESSQALDLKSAGRWAGMKIISRCEADTECAGEALARSLPDGSVVAMYGDLGAGKTAFVRGMARGLGLECRVSSPTFTIVNEYAGNGRELLHFDMYRLADSEELLGIGWDDYLARNAICAVGWSENIDDIFDGSEVVVRIEKLSDEQREIEIKGGGVLC